jgi:hypothetical protein
VALGVGHPDTANHRKVFAGERTRCVHARWRNPRPAGSAPAHSDLALSRP